MTRTARFVSRTLGAACIILLAWPVPEAAAQFGRTPGGSAVPRPQQEAARPPPPGLPGLQYRRGPEAIPADPNANLSPTEGLFDAINRGDLPAARDAVNRGADLDARNVLGLKPEEAAVDQNRNDILFYLLSVRGLYRNSGPPDAAAQAAARTGRTPRNAREARAAEPVEGEAPAPRGRRTRGGEQAPAGPSLDRSISAGPAAPRNPRLWAGDGGAAQPDLGFLGFDAGRPSGGGPVREARQRRAGG